MIPFRCWAPIALTVGLTACSGVASRIKQKQTAFDTYPPSVQEKIRNGRADVGFSPEQVELALGHPDRQYTRKTSSATQEIWVYGDDSVHPHVGFGFGFGFRSGAPGGMNSSIGMGTGTDDDSLRAARERVTFQGGAAISVESRRP